RRQAATLTALGGNRVIYWGGRVDNQPSGDGLLITLP
ncbi:MAG: hypothetical protein JWM93_3229, partial [Frankiales bacterium]|nr:hypothetical protein [Frankiales bacterium]